MFNFKNILLTKRIEIQTVHVKCKIAFLCKLQNVANVATNVGFSAQKNVKISPQGIHIPFQT